MGPLRRIYHQYTIAVCPPLGEFFFFFFNCCARDLTQVLAYGRQAPYHLSHASTLPPLVIEVSIATLHLL
jgi:hypothetical protein